MPSNRSEGAMLEADDLAATSAVHLPEAAPSNTIARLIALDEGFYALTLLGG